MPDEGASLSTGPTRTPWNKGKLIGAKPPLRPKHVWSIRTRLMIEGRTRDLAMFNLAIDSKLRGCDVVALKVEDVAPNGYTVDRATVRQRKTGRPVKFELTDQTRQAVDDYLRAAGKKPGEFLFASRRSTGRCMTARQYARLVSEWVASIDLDPRIYSTHSLRRTKVTLIYRRTGNLRAVQLLLGHSKIESTVRYLGIEVDDALAIAETNRRLKHRAERISSARPSSSASCQQHNVRSYPASARRRMKVSSGSGVGSVGSRDRLERRRTSGGSASMIDQTRRIAICHLLLRGTRWMPVSVSRELGPNDRCAPGGAVISALLCAVVEQDAVVGWTGNSAFMVREVGADGTLAPLDFKPTALALDAKTLDARAAAAEAVGISSLIAERRIQVQKTGNLPPALREAAFDRAEVQILDKLQGHSVVGVLLLDP